MRLVTFREGNFHGRHSIDGLAPRLTERRLREVKRERRRYVHRTKNGVYDPMTFYHIIDALLEQAPDEMFRTLELIEYLNESRQQLSWDATTVGRVINDMAESLNEKNATHPIAAIRRWNGTHYSVSARLEDRIAMENLMEDLAVLCEEEIEAELRGEFPKRITSPLSRCASLAV